MNCCYIYTHNNEVECGYFENMLYKSIETLLIFYNNEINDIYIFIDNNIDEEKYNNILNNLNNILCKYTKINLIVKLIDLEITNAIKYPENNFNKAKINKIGLVKFFIPYLVNCDDILYIDCDILFNGNNYYNIVNNYNSYIIFKIWNWNSGLILFNCKEWRNNKTIFKYIVNLYKEKKLDFVDNTCFHYLISEYKDNIIMEESSNINYCPDNLNDIKDNSIIHCCGWFTESKTYFNDIYNHIINNI